MIQWLLRFSIACISVAGFSLVAGTPAVNLIGGPNGVLSVSNPILVGWEFNVNSPISVDSLGIYTSISYPGQPGPTSGQVGLWDASQTLLASCTVLETDTVVDGFKYHQLASLTLQPGQNYILGALFLHSEAWSWYGNPMQMADEISFVGRRFRYFPDGLSSPPVDAPMGGFGPSFTFTPVPEPSCLALLALLAAIFGYGGKPFIRATQKWVILKS